MNCKLAVKFIEKYTKDNIISITLQCWRETRGCSHVSGM